MELNAAKLTKQIDKEVDKFVKSNITDPTPVDRMMIALAMKIGSTITLEHVLKG